MRAFVWLMFIYFFLFLLTYRFSDYDFVCDIGGQHDGQFALLVAWLCKTHYVVIACFVCRC